MVTLRLMPTSKSVRYLKRDGIDVLILETILNFYLRYIDTRKRTFRYNIKLDMSGEDNIDGIAHNDTTDRSTDVGFPKLYLGQTQTSGGYQIRATQNMPFQIITPICHNMTVTGTTIGAEIRTTSATSLSGDEIPYIDQGWESITVGESNYLTSPRAVYSKVNENDRLDICNDCDKNSNGRCSECGCFVDVKTSWASEACPLGHWLEYKDTPGKCGGCGRK